MSSAVAVFGSHGRPNHLDALLRKLSIDGVGASVTFASAQVSNERCWHYTQPLLGAVAAFNAAYDLIGSLGYTYVVTLNDDCLPVGDCVAVGVQCLNANPGVGQVAFALARHNQGPILQHVHGRVYANFGIIRQEIVEKVKWITGGMWSPCYYTYGADTELSCWVHRLGYEVRGLSKAVVEDYLIQDELRARNHLDNKAQDDNRTFWERWPDPRMLEPRGPLPNVTRAEKLRLQALEAST